MKLHMLTLPFIMASSLVAMDGIEAIELVDQEMVVRGLGLVPTILDKVSVLNREIGNDNAVFGTITLDTVGSYMPLDNITADIEITGQNIILDLSGRSIFGSIKISGNSVVVKNGAVIAHAPYNRDDTNAAIFIDESAKNVLIKGCHIICQDSVLTGSTFELVLTDTTNIIYEQVITGSVFESMPGRSGVEVRGDIVNVLGCSILPGASANTTVINAEQGGHGVVLNGTASKIRVLDCITVSGNGGNSTDARGGDAGFGIYVQGTATHIEISQCTIFGTGSGGNGLTGGGHGGHGMRIEADADDVGVHNCHIRNTGNGGTPDGSAGKAIDDDVVVTGKRSQIFSNFAHNIGNEIKFDLQATNTETGIPISNPPTNVVVNPFANVYVP